jgi:2-(1,2-epoxy-1,2-dihydrophenyl)acetyl-CoA isomerase
MDVISARDGAVATITLNRPDSLNAYTRSLLGGLRAALEDAADADVRSVVITGAGRAFCVGQDLRELRDLEPRQVEALLVELYHPVILAIRELEKPVIAAVNGPAAGAGIALAAACDIRIASDRAVFAPAFTAIGLVPDSGTTHLLTRLLGAPRAWEWVASGRRLTAAEAGEWGIVGEVVAADAFPARVAAVAREAAELPTAAVGAAKRLFDEAATSSLADQLAREASAQAVAYASDDHREGAAAFAEKRAPSFSGR